MTPRQARRVVDAYVGVTTSFQRLRKELDTLLQDVEQECGVTACRASMQQDRIAGLDYVSGCQIRGFPCDEAGVPCVVLPVPEEDFS